MNITPNTVPNAITGINVQLSTIELVVIADLREQLEKASETTLHIKVKPKIDPEVLNKTITLLRKLSNNVPSHQEVHDDLFDIMPDKTEVKP